MQIVNVFPLTSGMAYPSKCVSWVGECAIERDTTQLSRPHSAMVASTRGKLERSEKPGLLLPHTESIWSWTCRKKWNRICSYKAIFRIFLLFLLKANKTDNLTPWFLLWTIIMITRSLLRKYTKDNFQMLGIGIRANKKIQVPFAKENCTWKGIPLWFKQNVFHYFKFYSGNKNAWLLMI